MRNFAGPTVAWSLRVRPTYEREKTEAERDKRPFPSTLLGDSDFGALDSLRTGRRPVVFFRHVYFEIRTSRLTHLAIRYGDQASMWRFFFFCFLFAEWTRRRLRDSYGVRARGRLRKRHDDGKLGYSYVYVRVFFTLSSPKTAQAKATVTSRITFFDNKFPIMIYYRDNSINSTCPVRR